MSDELSAPIKGVLNKLSIKDLDIKGKRLFIRVDFNVPLDENQNITDDRRIRSSMARWLDPCRTPADLLLGPLRTGRRRALVLSLDA